ncbi:MAG TPA: hypothetical protein VKR53_16110 [Puia sp.]|nr:hypothetical protein [Puia sp.]
MLKFILLLSVIMILFACKKNNTNNSNSSTLSGVYDEVIPYDQTTRLDFVNGNTVIISGEKLINQPSLRLGTNQYQINTNGQLVFYSDSANIKDTTALWFMKESVDTLRLSTCPFDFSCMIQTFTYAFKKQ